MPTITPTITEESPTPWGPVQTHDHLGAGVHVVDTPGHGGLYVPPAILNTVPPKVRDIVLTEQGWGRGWAEEDCNLPIAMAFVYPHLDAERVRRTFPAQDRSGLEPQEFWNTTALRVAGEYKILQPCIPYLEADNAQQKLDL